MLEALTPVLHLILILTVIAASSSLAERCGVAIIILIDALNGWEH